LLREVSIEAQTGFTFGLEATVKAHLGGYTVDEVPVTWTDRTAGQSNFRVAKWLKAYLHWYLLAIRTPLLVWAAWVFLLGASLTRLAAPLSAVLPLASLALIIGARRWRRRMHVVDAIVPLVCGVALLLSRG
jgi:hypothetical protein